MSKYYLDRTRIDLEDDNELNLGDPDIIPRTKPLRWRTGPVPRHVEVLYEIPEDYHGVGFGMLNGKIRDHGSVPYTEARWLPLSEILLKQMGEYELSDTVKSWTKEHGEGPSPRRPGTQRYALEDPMTRPIIFSGAMVRAIHGPGAWDRNDYVWRIEFRRVEG